MEGKLVTRSWDRQQFHQFPKYAAGVTDQKGNYDGQCDDDGRDRLIARASKILWDSKCGEITEQNSSDVSERQSEI